MKWLSYTLAALLAVAIAVSIFGIVADSERLDLWTQTLMWCMLGTVVLVPFAVFAGTRPKKAPMSSTAPAAGRSPLRLAAYAFSVVAVIWTAVSMISLFIDPANLAFWTQSVLWSLLILVVWAPVMAFFINPFQETRYEPAGKVPEQSVPDFVDHDAHSLTPTDASTAMQPEGAVVEQQDAASASTQENADNSDAEDRGWPFV